jgi:hypothetical protein
MRNFLPNSKTKFYENYHLFDNQLFDYFIQLL